MASVDIFSARLVPAPGVQGWLCRHRGAVVWMPEAVGAELIVECLSTSSPTELLGRVASRLADASSPLWPPFVLVAGRGADVVVLVHGPAEVSVTQDGTEIRLYGGDEVGSWLNRLIRNCSSVSAGKPASAEGPEDLREGAVRADGFLLAAPGLLSPARPSSGEIGEHIGPTGLDGLAGAAEAGAPPAGTSAEAPSEVGSPTDADSPTVVEQPAVGTDLTVAEQGAEGAPADAGAAPPGQSLLGRLTWDNGEVHELTAAVLIGREVANDPAVSAGQLVPLVPSGQNDSMSRVHAELRPRGGDVLVTDRASTNGTFVWDEGARAWHRLMPGEPYAVPGGGVLAFGERTATFEALTARVG